MKKVQWLIVGAIILSSFLIGWSGKCHHEIKLLHRQVSLLETALAPTAPRLAANNWAEAVKTRNGAWQYALLSPGLKEKYRSEFESLNWVTGASSPWVKNYDVKRLTADTTENIKYEIKFNWYTAQGYFGTSTAELWLAVQGKGENRTWYIRQIKYNKEKMDKSTIAAIPDNVHRFTCRP
ncbi:MAG: hypothetical protein ACM3NT_09100 [Methylocystaceae bacterium]